MVLLTVAVEEVLEPIGAEDVDVIVGFVMLLEEVAVMLGDDPTWNLQSRRSNNGQ